MRIEQIQFDIALRIAFPQVLIRKGLRAIYSWIGKPITLAMSIQDLYLNPDLRSLASEIITTRNMKCVHILDWKTNYIGIHKLDQALTAAFLLKPSTKHTGILHRNMPQQNLRLSVSMIFIQYSVVNRESKFETRKFDRERK